ncbi:MAG: hypothetical protein ACOZFS_03060 [Thermodesulfobacteriota bacterium]
MDAGAQNLNAHSTVAMCDDASTVKFIQDNLLSRQPIDAWVALTPPAALALSERGIPYLVIDDFIDEPKQLGNFYERLAFQMDWAQWVDHYLQSRLPEFRELELFPCQAFFYRINNFFDRLNVHRAGLQALFSKLRPRKILWVSRCESCGKEDNFLDQHIDIIKEHHYTDIIFDMLIPLLAKETGAEVEVFSLPNKMPASLHGNILTSQARNNRFLRDRKIFAKKIINRIKQKYQRRQLYYQARKAFAPKLLPARGASLLVLQDSYDMYYVLPLLAAAGFKLIKLQLNKMGAATGTINADKITSGLQAAWQEIQKQEKFWALLEGWEPGRKIVTPWLHRLWHRSFLEFWQAVENGKAYLADKQYHGVVLANTQSLYPYEPAIGLLHAARFQGIPVFTYLHGSLPGYCQQPIQALLDMPHSDYHFVYGPGVASYLNQVAKDYLPRPAQAVAGGSPRIDAIKASYCPQKTAALRKKMAGNDERKLILHIPNFLFYHRRFTGDAYPCMSCFKLQKQLIDLFAHSKNTRLVYRSIGRDWPEVMPNLIKSCLEDVIIADFNDISLFDLMWAVDGIILDYPATPLAEVLLTHKPLVVYSDKRYYPMTDEAKALLRKRAIITESIEEHLNAVKKFLAQENFSEEHSSNDEFLHHYVINEFKEGSALHVANFITDIIVHQPQWIGKPSSVTV